ncbi:MAG TPA: hypothetical protein VGM88_11545 [Kofleriaceae bacterium]|jgi:hypothetical protein
MLRTVAALSLALFACGGGHIARDAPVDAGVDSATPGAPGTVGRYEAEATTLVGGATIVGAADASDRAVGDLAGEASGRQAVTLASAGDGIRFTVRAELAGANAVVVRYSLPDAAGGGGAAAPLSLVTPSGTIALVASSRYTWLYGSVAAGTKLYNVPANAQANEGAAIPTHLYDELQLALPAALAEGAEVSLVLPAGSPAVTLDFVELEIVAPPLAQPADLLSITDPQCGAIAFDARGTGAVFDGADDASYASTFVAVPGVNPFGVATAETQEKDYYASAPSDVLQDESPGPTGLSMWDLADRNLASLQACLAVVTAADSGYTGLWIPPGRFYARGTLTVPSNVAIRGAGMWLSKLVAVDTAPPTTMTNPQTMVTGIASTSGDLRIFAPPAGADRVTLSDFAMFGNVTQRDHVDKISPVGVVGPFTNSTFERLWVEHYQQGIMMNGVADGDVIDGMRVRDVLADGIDLYGTASHSTISNSSSRGTGDDGFAIWSQGATTQSTGNRLTNAVAELQWDGNGYGIYGGTDVALDTIVARDSLTGAGLKVATEFVPTTLPADQAMTGATVSNAQLIRCGGDAFGKQYGAVLIGAEEENLEALSLDRITVVSPTYAAFDVRLLSSIGAVTSPGSVDALAITHAEVLGATSCASVSSNGSAAFDACACATAGGPATTCSIATQAPFTITANGCAESTCAF